MCDEKIFVDIRINYVTRLLSFTFEEIKNPGIVVAKGKCFKILLMSVDSKQIMK